MAPFPPPPSQSNCYILLLYGVHISSLTHWFDYRENEQNNELLQPKSLEFEQTPIQPAEGYSIVPLKGCPKNLKIKREKNSLSLFFSTGEKRGFPF